MATTTDTGVLSDQEWALLREDLGLSPRQAQIVKRISQAMSDKQIARELGVSLSTVRTHMGRLFQKYDLNDRMELLVHVFSLLRSHWRNGELSPSQSVTDVDSGCEYPSVR